MFLKLHSVCFCVLLFAVQECVCIVHWDVVRCSSDPDQTPPEGRVSHNRFPWLGAIQHTFMLGGASRFAITSAVLVHPGYVIAAADDMARIHPQMMENNTKFIVWKNEQKYTVDIREYFLHPEYGEAGTYATLALVVLMNTRGYTGAGTNSPVLPACLPLKGAGTFSEMYAVKFADDDGELHKEAFRMNLVEDQECAEFYYKAKLDYKVMSPVSSVCATAAAQTAACVWEAGVALVTRLNWGQWTLLGFGMRGPGCGAPARFLPLSHYVHWVEEVITRRHTDVDESDRVVLFRRVSPIKLVMYDVTKTKVPNEAGQCEKDTRGNVLYKDNSEILVNKNFAQGFFYMSALAMMSIKCAVVNLEVSARTNAAVWIEHHCVRDYTGDRTGFEFKDDRSRNCFVYFKSLANIEFRFYFSFRAILEVTLYGVEDQERFVPNPWLLSDSTYEWIPTFDRLLRHTYEPAAYWKWHM